MLTLQVCTGQAAELLGAGSQSSECEHPLQRGPRTLHTEELLRPVSLTVTEL